MKFKLGVLLMSVLFLTTCSTDDLTIEKMTLSKSQEKAIVTLVETNLSIDAETKVVITSTKLKKIGDNYYLSSYHGDKITTTLLKVVEGNHLEYAGISCTSVSCANDDGCIPHKDGKKCTKCSWGGDCKKTVTSDDFLNQ